MCELVLTALRTEGRDAVQTGRPDRETGAGRRADFLLSVDGQPVALEVTRTASEVSQRHAYLSHRLGEGIKQRLSREVEQRQLGHVLFSYQLLAVNRQPPPRRAIDAAIPVLAGMIADAIPLVLERGERQELPGGDIVDRLRINVHQTGTNAVSYLSGMGAAFVAVAADDAVQRVVASKAEQLARYPRAYLALSEPNGFIDRPHFGDAFIRAVDTVPANWLRVYLLERDNPARVALIFDRE